MSENFIQSFDARQDNSAFFILLNNKDDRRFGLIR